MKNFLFIFLFSCISFLLKGQASSLTENFTTCVSSMPLGWQQYSVTGTDAWTCTSAGMIGRGVKMNGYSGGSYHNNEDWLISPEINLSAYANPKLSFWCKTAFVGNFIEVKVSTNYVSGNPNTATWINLPINLPTSNSNTWFLSDNIDLTSFKANPLHIAIKYISTTSAAATWTLDELCVTDGTLVLSKKFLNVGECLAGTSSSSTNFNFTMTGAITNFEIQAAYPFEISKDGVSFATQLSYSNSIVGNSQIVYVRMNPTASDKVFRNSLTFKHNGNLLNDKVFLLGTSMPDYNTLKVYNWNMRWFGDPTNCACDTNQARLNATQILKDIHADIYCVQEVVSTSQLALVANSLGSNYNYVVSPYGSLAPSTSSGNYAGCQKEAYIYNTNKIQNLGTFGLLASNTDTAAYNCFSSGRYPFIMSAKLLLNSGNSDTIIFSNIHAKAISDVASYNRRKCGAQKMTDSLNALFGNKKVLVLGDFNDFLEGTDVTSLTLSPYKYALDNGFTGITLPSKYPNQSTYVGSSNNIIDNIMCNSNMLPKYIDSSCFFFSEVENYIDFYGTTTSDHIPVMSYYRFNFPNAVHDISFERTSNFFTLINPSSNQLEIQVNEVSSSVNYTLQVVDMMGKCVFKSDVRANNKIIKQSMPQVQTGIYFVELNNGTNRSVQKWLVQ